MTVFEQDCIHHHGRILDGKHKHYCPDFDYLPIDDTCFEYEFCVCEFEDEEEE